MDGFDHMNELVTLLQKFEDIESLRAGEVAAHITPQAVLTMVNENPEQFQDIIARVRDNPASYTMTKSEVSPYNEKTVQDIFDQWSCLLYTSPSPRDS